jgi:hypothetical protein
MSWLSGLKEWNAGKGTWCIPKKGTQGHVEVMAIINSKKSVKPSPSASPPVKTNDEIYEDKRVAEMRLYLARRKAFSRLKDPIRDKLERANVTRVEDAQIQDEWNEKFDNLVEKWKKSASYKAIQDTIDARPDGSSRYIDPKDLLNPTTPEWKKAAASKYGVLIVEHLKKTPVLAKDVGRRFNTKPGSDELGMLNSTKRDLTLSMYPKPK